MIKLAFFISFIAFLACAKPLPPVQEGDIIFHTSKSSQSLAIQRATKSPYSHMGIIFIRDGQPFVFEAAKTVKYTPLRNWIKRGVGQHYVVKRLKDSNAVLTPKALEGLRAAAKNLEGKPYDLTFEWSDDRIYCSELVWKIYKRGADVEIGSLQKIKDFDLSDPIVAGKMHERYGDKVPLDEPVISPAAMFNSEKLQTVAEN